MRDRSLAFLLLLCATALAGVTLVASCSGSPPNEGETVPPDAVFPLPTHAGLPGCRDIGLLAMVTGDPSDPRVAWLVDLPDGEPGMRLDVAWPPGSTARFTPEIEILNRGGDVVMREGHIIGGACVGAEGILNIHF